MCTACVTFVYNYLVILTLSCYHFGCQDRSLINILIHFNAELMKNLKWSGSVQCSFIIFHVYAVMRRFQSELIICACSFYCNSIFCTSLCTSVCV